MAMLDRVSASPSPLCRRLRALACLSVLGVAASPASALPPPEPVRAPALLLVQAEPPGSGQEGQEDPQAPLNALNRVLEDTRAKLEELTQAAAALAADGDLRKVLRALERENERLAAQLQQANARSTELARANELAEARVAELTEAVEEAVQKAARADEALAGQIQRNRELDESLARAETARAAAVAEAEKTRAELAQTLEGATGKAAQSQAELARLREELEAATDEAAQSKAELASLREEFEANLQELAMARSARDEAGSWASKLEEVVERSGVEVERVEAELAAVKGQLGQAAGAAVEAERARQAMSDQAESLRRDAARARDELRAANAEIARLKATNAEQEKEIASWRTSSTSAIETARQNLVIMEKKIEELTAALVLGQPAEAAPAPAPRARSAPVEDGRATPAQSPTIAPRSRPERASKTDAGASADRPIERSESKISMAGPTAAPADADARLAGFHANIEALNDLELSTEGVDLFSGIASVDGRTVHVGATAAWNSLPTVGKQSYLDFLLDLWMAAQGGQGPAVVRIVDPNGRVLVEKSRP